MLIYGQLRFDYAIVQSFLVIVATNFGTQLQMLIVKQSGGKYQYQVLMMVIIVIGICVSSAGLAVLTIAEKHAQGMPIFRFEANCGS